jgi:hypothetical protein
MMTSHHQNAGQNHNINTANAYFEKVEKCKCLGTTATNQILIHGEGKNSLNSGNACCHSVQNILSSSLLYTNVKINLYQNIN